MNCIICSSSKQKHLFTIKKPSLSPDVEYRLWECQDCLFWYADGPLTESILNKIYGDDFHKTSQQDTSKVSKAGRDSSEPPIILNARRRVSEIMQYKPSGSLLDVGAGRGFFIKTAAGTFNARGIEFSEAAVNFAGHEGIDIVAGDFLTHDFDTETFDVVTLWDVLSSFKDPNKAIAKVFRLLKSKGLLVMTLPYSSSLTAKLLRKYWPLMIPPINVSYFSRDSISIMLEKHGFTLVKLTCDAKKVSLDFILRKLFRTVGAYSFENIVPLWTRRVNLTLNLGDIITVYAEKK